MANDYTRDSATPCFSMYMMFSCTTTSTTTSTTTAATPEVQMAQVATSESASSPVTEVLLHEVLLQIIPAKLLANAAAVAHLVCGELRSLTDEDLQVVGSL